MLVAAFASVVSVHVPLQGLSVSGCPSEHIAAATEERQREQISQAHHLKEAFCLYAMGHGQTESIMSPSAFGSPVQFLNLVTSFGGSCMGGLIVAEGFGGFSRYSKRGCSVGPQQ